MARDGHPGRLISLEGPADHPSFAFVGSHQSYPSADPSDVCHGPMVAPWARPARWRTHQVVCDPRVSIMVADRDSRPGKGGTPLDLPGSINDHDDLSSALAICLLVNGPR